MENWNDLIISVCSLILTGLAGWALTTFTNWMNDRLKGKRAERYAQEALDIVVNCVKATYQTYVDSIKGTDAWTKEAQQKALDLAVSTAKARLNADVTEYITENYGDLNMYLIGLVESVIYDLKK